MTENKQRLEHFHVATPIRLALLWAALMSLYATPDPAQRYLTR